jgi:hypothetical protein
MLHYAIRGDLSHFSAQQVDPIAGSGIIAIFVAKIDKNEHE